MSIETIQARLEELETHITNFPNSKLRKLLFNEINYLNAILNYKSKEEIEYLKSLL